MKNLKKIVFLFALTTVLSCSNASDDDLGLSGSGNMSAKVDGQDWSSLQATIGATVTSGVAAIQGSTSGGDFIRLNIVNYNGVGTYGTGDNLSNANSATYGTAQPVAAWTSTFNIGSGTIEITDDNASTISGTFTFTGFNGTDSKNITEGKFTAPKQ